MSARVFIVYDGRAVYPNGTDDAAVLEAIGQGTLGWARREAMKCWSETDSVLYSYAIKGKTLTDQLYHGYVDKEFMVEPETET